MTWSLVKKELVKKEIEAIERRRTWQGQSFRF